MLLEHGNYNVIVSSILIKTTFALTHIKVSKYLVIERQKAG
jgi:hypothetical protein